jgi:hypothetical protein
VGIAAGFILVYLGYRALLKLATIDPVVRASGDVEEGNIG